MLKQKVNKNDYVRGGFYKALLSFPKEYTLSIRRLPNDIELCKDGRTSYEFFLWEKIIIEKALINHNYVSRKN